MFDDISPELERGARAMAAHYHDGDERFWGAYTITARATISATLSEPSDGLLFEIERWKNGDDDRHIVDIFKDHICGQSGVREDGDSRCTGCDRKILTGGIPGPDDTLWCRECWDKIGQESGHD